jgi:uncharacterized protein (DUF1778 family)
MRPASVKAESASTRVNLRFAPTVKAMIRQAAQLRQFTLTDFIVRSAQDAAQTVLAEQTRFILPAEQWRAFNAALDAPAKEIPALRRLLTEPSVFEKS